MRFPPLNRCITERKINQAPQGIFDLILTDNILGFLLSKVWLVCKWLDSLKNAFSSPFTWSVGFHTPFSLGVGDASLRMHRLHDVLQFFETSLKNRIVKN